MTGRKRSEADAGERVVTLLEPHAPGGITSPGPGQHLTSQRSIRSPFPPHFPIAWLTQNRHHDSQHTALAPDTTSPAEIISSACRPSSLSILRSGPTSGPRGSRVPHNYNGRKIVTRCICDLADQERGPARSEALAGRYSMGSRRGARGGPCGGLLRHSSSVTRARVRPTSGRSSAWDSLRQSARITVHLANLEPPRPASHTTPRSTSLTCSASCARRCPSLGGRTSTSRTARPDTLPSADSRTATSLPAAPHTSR
jgi:hypothetical protein